MNIPSSIMTIAIINEDSKLSCARSKFNLWKINSTEWTEKIKNYELETTIKLKSGLYILLDDDRSRIYIGETDRLYNRIKEHFEQKDWIHDFILIFSENKGVDIDKDSLKYIENKLINEVPNGIELINKQQNYKKKLSFIKRGDLNKDWNYINQYLKICEPLIFNQNIKQVSKIEGRYINDNLKKYIKIYVLDNEKNKVFGLFDPENNSIIFKKNQEFQIRFRDHYLKKGKDKKINKYLKLTEIKTNLYKAKIIDDIRINAPSTASSLITGQKINGWKHWKINDNNKIIETIRYANNKKI